MPKRSSETFIGSGCLHSADADFRGTVAPVKNPDFSPFVGERHALPDHLRQIVEDVHDIGCTTLTAEGRPHEPVDVALAVEAHRWFWRPRNVKVVLIAESHVWTDPEHVSRRMTHPILQRIEDAASGPGRYCRVIYCLASGETALLDDPSGVPPQQPTEFWNIFGRIAQTGRVPTRSSGADLEARITWKVHTLTTLAELGVWLLDASVHAIYTPSGRVSSRGAATLHRQWAAALGDVYLAGAPSASRFAIGKSVSTALNAADVHLDDFIYQPQAARGRVDMTHGWDRLLSAVHGPA